MVLRVNSLKQLGSGAWKVSAASPFDPAKLNDHKPVKGAVLTPTPHDLLWSAVGRFEGAVREHPGAIPGRKYRIDIAFPAQKLAVEVDGWAFHGRRKGDFTRDRTRQNHLTLNGWRILRFTAGQIHKELELCAAQVKAAIMTHDLAQEHPHAESP